MSTANCIVQHSSQTDLWYSPKDILEKVKNVLGVIDFDPASDPFGNSRVGAQQYLSAEDNGLDLAKWPKNPVSVYLNPPGGKSGNQSNTALFWMALMKYRMMYPIRHAIFMCFSAEALQTTQNKGYCSAANFMVCIPSKRLTFDDHLGNPGCAPSHSNAIVYVPGSLNRGDLFETEFADIGAIMCGRCMR